MLKLNNVDGGKAEPAQTWLLCQGMSAR